MKKLVAMAFTLSLISGAGAALLTENFNSNPTDNGWTFTSTSGTNFYWDSGNGVLVSTNFYTGFTQGDVAAATRPLGVTLTERNSFKLTINQQIAYAFWFDAFTSIGVSSS
jgi:hypothetical protein